MHSWWSNIRLRKQKRTRLICTTLRWVVSCNLAANLAKHWIEQTRPTRCNDLGTKLSSAACAWTGTPAHPSAHADGNQANRRQQKASCHRALMRLRLGGIATRRLENHNRICPTPSGPQCRDRVHTRTHKRPRGRETSTAAQQGKHNTAVALASSATVSNARAWLAVSNARPMFRCPLTCLRPRDVTWLCSELGRLCDDRRGCAD